MKMVKKVTCVLIATVMMITIVACSKAPDDEYTPDVGGDEQGTPLFTKGLSVDTLYALENLEITPWEFVETYTPNSITGNEYFYRMKNGFELTLTLGESWKDTYIKLYDTVRDISWSLCKHDGEDVYSAVVFHQTKKHVHTITTSSADGSSEVTRNRYISFVLGSATGEFRPESDPKEN